MNAKLAKRAIGQLDDLPPEVRRYLLGSIKAALPYAGQQMVVKGMTLALPDHIYRAFKFYAYRPGYRIIFYFCSPDTILIESVCRRDCDPYGDGH